MTKELIPDSAGFQPALRTDRFLCAWITYAAQYAYGKVTAMKRHLTSAEVFLLLRGCATLLTMEPDGTNRCITELVSGKAICVEAGTWHYLAVSEDALVFVTENNDVTAQNTETLCLEEPYEILSGLSASK